MNPIYANNQEVTTFITKAQNKIADLATLLVERAADISPLNILALELIDFIENLDNPLTTWELEDVLRWIHEYNYRANLGELAYLNIYGYNTTLIQNIVGTNTITSSNITDFELAVLDLFRKFQHNQLNGLQGGTLTERYHLDKKGYDYVNAQANPTTASTVALNLTTNGVQWPSGYYELGTSIGVVNLAGSITYGTDKKANYFEYKRGSTVLGTRTTNPASNSQPNAISDTSGITTSTIYTFNASFPDGLKIASQEVNFRQPMYYGIVNIENYQTNDLMLGTKDVRDRGEMTLSFNLPAGNTTVPEGTHKVPFLFIPDSWGKFKSAISSTFEFVNDWREFGRDMTLADGSIVPGRLIIYPTQIEGLNTFKFSW